MWNWQIGLAKYVSHHQSWWVSSSELISAIIRVQMFHLLSHTSSCGVICEVQMFHWGLDQPEREGRRAWQFCGKTCRRRFVSFKLFSLPHGFVKCCHLGFFSACLIDLSPIRCCHTDLSQTSNLNIFVLFILASLTAEVELTFNKEEKLISQWIWWYSEYNRYTKYGQLACCQRSFFSS